MVTTLMLIDFSEATDAWALCPFGDVLKKCNSVREPIHYYFDDLVGKGVTLPPQCCQPPIFSPDICAKSESNPKCLRKSLHQTNPKRRVFAMKPVLRQKRVFSTKPFWWQKRIFVELQPGHVIIGMIPATLSMQKTMHMTIIRLLT